MEYKVQVFETNVHYVHLGFRSRLFKLVWPLSSFAASVEPKATFRFPFAYDLL